MYPGAYGICHPIIWCFKCWNLATSTCFSFSCLPYAAPPMALQRTSAACCDCIIYCSNIRLLGINLKGVPKHYTAQSTRQSKREEEQLRINMWSAGLLQCTGNLWKSSTMYRILQPIDYKSNALLNELTSYPVGTQNPPTSVQHHLCQITFTQSLALCSQIPLPDIEEICHCSKNGQESNVLWRISPLFPLPTVCPVNYALIKPISTTPLLLQ